jgi:RimJ/RimL family protein N-acetyltransferase
VSADEQEVAIRPIEAADADGYIAVFEAVAAEGRWIGAELPFDEVQRARWRASAASAPDDAFTIVAIAGSRLVGFAHIGLDRGHAHLGMAVLDGFRGRGIGRRLLDGCIDWARAAGAHKVDLEVWPHNAAALRLYEAAGFSIEGRRRRHWRRNSGELWDSIEMGLVLDETAPGSPYSEG